MANEWHFGESTVKDTQGTAYYHGKKAKEIWMNGKCVWKSGTPWPRYSWWIDFSNNPKQVDLSKDGLGIVDVDCCGTYLTFNDGAVVEKVAFYLDPPHLRVGVNSSSNSDIWYDYSGAFGENITSVLWIGFFAYKGKIVVLGYDAPKTFARNPYSSWPSVPKRWSVFGDSELISPIRWNYVDVNEHWLCDKDTVNIQCTEAVERVYSVDAVKRYLT